MGFLPEKMKEAVSSSSIAHLHKVVQIYFVLDYFITSAKLTDPHLLTSLPLDKGERPGSPPNRAARTHLATLNSNIRPKNNGLGCLLVETSSNPFVPIVSCKLGPVGGNSKIWGYSMYL